MTVTRAVVQLENGGYGYSYIAGRDKAHAELCALLDALLQLPEQAELLQQQLIEPLAALQHEQRQLRARAVASSRVDFFTLVRGD
jgi:alpha-D-ribose 1-methylphosphonate 5-triphosphate synthase subunit PhnG